MVGSTQDIIVVAQAETGNALQDGVVEAAPAAETGEDHAVTVGEEHGVGETHAGTEAHSEAFPPFDPTYFSGQLIWLAITFAALYVLMSRVALPRIGSILDTRRTRIEGDLKEAERLRMETERAAAEYDAALAEARSNAHRIAEETRTSIKLDIENRRADVEAGLAAKVTEAEARIADTKQAAMANVGDIAAETAQALVARISGNVTAKQAKDAVTAASKEQG
ncbi:ATP F0F1 synthase subunit B [Devosia sp.]|uniref:F0F1 ATP synthase subunit B family protein n=1 Tax=Devosia sp. TaxID=1871048 RepID=UPI003A92A9D2